MNVPIWSQQSLGLDYLNSLIYFCVWGIDFWQFKVMGNASY